MKKSLFIIASAALVLSSCAEDSLRNNIKGEDQAISFETFAQKATRAENSNQSNKNSLEAYHESFKVWGSKYVSSAEAVVFNAQDVDYVSSDAKWEYSPVRFWDKSANKYDFYAAAPADLSWNWNNTKKKLSLSSFSVDGVSLPISTTCSSDAIMPNGKDIMISTDEIRDNLLGSPSYSTVHLLFNHILSRMNIAVKKDAVLNDFIVKLDKVKVYDMLRVGDFDENEASADAASGNASRWKNQNTTYAFGYEVSGDARVAVASGDTYIYQGLIIPQTVETETVALNAANATKPYIKIGYTLQQASGDAVIDIPGGAYEYTYNLADLFNGKNDDLGTITFNEGWQNNLKITIKPDIIEFCAEVFEWADQREINVQVPNNASGDAQFD